MAVGLGPYKETTSPGHAKTKPQREQCSSEADCLLLWGPLPLPKTN